MGTRADFYVGRGADAEWLGSIAWDGYPDDDDISALLKKKAPTSFRKAVKAFLTKREDATLPAQGWPWPWEDSRTTDYAYAFDDGKVWASCFGYGWRDKAALDAYEKAQAAYNASKGPEPKDLWDKTKTATFPDMSARKNIAWDGRSGLMVVGTK